MSQVLHWRRVTSDTPSKIRQPTTTSRQTRSRHEVKHRPQRRTNINALLIEPEQLHADIDQDTLVVHVADAATFTQAHVPGAMLVEPRELVCGIPPASGRLPELGQLEALFARLNYDPSNPDRLIVAYDDEGGGWAGRFLWTLDVIGHKHWGYLNGGIQAWAEAGYAVGRGLDEPEISSNPAENRVSLEINLDAVAEISDVLEAIEDPKGLIWDVRSPEEYAGTRQASARVGHIPGAVNLDWMRLKDPANAMRLVADLKPMLERKGITPDKNIITHCQSHHRSGLSYLVGRLLGYPNIRAYHGSWSEWGNRDDTPIEL